MRVLERKCECTVRSIVVDDAFIRKVSRIEALLTIAQKDIHNTPIAETIPIVETLIEVDAFINTLNAIIDGKHPDKDDDFEISYLK